VDRTGKIILVTGATGRQGGAVTRHLVARGWQVRALIRNPHRPEVEALRERGVAIAEGDLYDRASLDRAAEGVYGVYSMQDFIEHGVEGEVRQGKTLAEVAKSHGVQHLVYSSFGGAERRTGIPHAESKWQIEEHIRSLDIPHTILRPAWFMANFCADSYYDAIRGGVLAMALRPDRAMQMIDVDDIGGLVTLAYDHPDEYIGRAIEIAGDELTGPQMAALFSEAMQRPVRYVQVPISALRQQSEATARVFEWLNESGYQADIPALRRLYPPLSTLAEWLRAVGYGDGARETGARR